MLAVLRERNFALLWLAGLISLTGDWMLFVALPVAAYQLTGSPLATAAVMIAGRLPALLLGTVAGVFVDRWDRRRTMIAANLVRAPVLLLLLAVDSADRIWLLYAVAAAVSAGSQFFRPAENALLPSLVGEDQLVPANALNALNDNLARLVGPALGGLTVAAFGLGGAAAVDAGSFLVAAALIAAIRAPGRLGVAPASGDTHAPSPESRLAERWAAVGQEWRDGLRVVAGSPVLRAVFGVVAISSLGEGVMGTAFWVFVDEALHGGAWEAGLLTSAQAIGGMVGAVVVGSRFQNRSPVLLLAWGSIGIGVADLATFNYPAFLPGIWLGLLFMGLGGLPGTAFGAGFTSAIQAETDDGFRGRVFGALNATSALLMIVGAAVAAVATARLGAVTVLSIDAAAYIAGGVFALRTMASGSANRSRLEEAEAA